MGGREGLEREGGLFQKDAPKVPSVTLFGDEEEEATATESAGFSIRVLHSRKTILESSKEKKAHI